MPHLVREWHPSLNGDLSPKTVSAGSRQATISNRVRVGCGCPMCAGKVATAKTSLKALHPELAREWHPTKNGALRPADVRPGSDKRVWWRCRFNPHHAWEASVYNRARRKTGCPDCQRAGGRRKKQRKRGVRVPILV